MARLAAVNGGVHSTLVVLKLDSSRADPDPRMPRSTRIRSEDGFTLIELMVVVLIIAILAAIALPAFLSQRAKAQDGAAKSDARAMVGALEGCYTEVARYDPCPGPDTGIEIGNQRGQVEATPAGDTYVVVAYSQTG